MSLTTLKLEASDFSPNIQSLPNKVQNEAATLKAAFDYPSTVVTTAINAIIDLLIASGAAELGAAALYEGDTAGTIQSKLQAIYTAMQGLALGSIPDGSISLDKLDAEAQAGLLHAELADAVPWTGVSGKPTTISGYGITDAAASSHVGGTATTKTAAREAMGIYVGTAMQSDSVGDNGDICVFPA